MRLIERISNTYIKFIKIYMMCLFAIMVFVMFLQVVFRYAGHPFGWSEELTTYMQVALVFPGIAYCLKNKSHIEMTALYDRLSDTAKKVCDLIGSIIMLWCGGVFIGSVTIFLKSQNRTALTMEWLKLDVFYFFIIFLSAIVTELYLLANFYACIKALYQKMKVGICK